MLASAEPEGAERGDEPRDCGQQVPSAGEATERNEDLVAHARRALSSRGECCSLLSQSDKMPDALVTVRLDTVHLEDATGR
ncbi:hypothetical protein [Mobilicoccus massiliensis]|uniref:hypothetical protein n=1 Tax=Mobilicoccus massiliensis TaxID=1522310 RepID=UPI00058F04A7|nr:hypothetical protein [Mobilicoccus massiliensis]